MTSQTNPSTWLTAKRLHAHGTILLVCLWSLYIWNLATPGLRDRAGNLKGTDFLHFYTLGCVARVHDGGNLYNMHAQAALAAQRVPQAAGIRYLPLYPPQVSIFFAPFAYLSYPVALALWWSFCAFAYGLCCYLMWRTCPNLGPHGGLVFLLAAAFPPFFHLIAWGQTSALALLCFAAAFHFLRKDRDGSPHDFLAGFCLGCLVFKPQLGVAAAVLFCALRRWKVVAGMMISAAIQLSIGVLYYGWEPLRRWGGMLERTSQLLPLLEPKPYQTHSLRTFWSMLLPWPAAAMALYLTTSGLVLYFLFECWKREFVPLSLKYPALLLATVLIAPHLTVYDLVLLAPALLLLADWLQGQSRTRATLTLATLLYLVYALPLIGPLARWTHLQLSVIAMFATIFLIRGISVDGSSDRKAGKTPLVSSMGGRG